MLDTFRALRGMAAMIARHPFDFIREPRKVLTA